ncbi:hypothetical protein [Pseudomonas cerasi]
MSLSDVPAQPLFNDLQRCPDLAQRHLQIKALFQQLMLDAVITLHADVV